jgi:hypothetical protein
MGGARLLKEGDCVPSKSITTWETVLHFEAACTKYDWSAALA